MVLANPLHQAAFDVGCGLLMAMMVAAKIFTYSVLIFQVSSTVQLRASVTYAAFIGVLLMSVILMCKSRFPFIVVVPDMFSAPYVIQMFYTLAGILKDPGELNATVLALVFLIVTLSGIFHVLMSSFRLFRVAEFLPYPVFCGLFSAVGLTIVQRSILFAPGYQIIATLVVAISLSLKILKQRETRPALTFVCVVISSISVFYIVASANNQSIADLQDSGWLVEPLVVDSIDSGAHLVPWYLWLYGSCSVDFRKIQWRVLLEQCGATVALLLLLIALRRSMQLLNLNRLFSCRAKINSELVSHSIVIFSSCSLLQRQLSSMLLLQALHGYAQVLSALLGTFGGIFSGPDMVRVKRMHGGEVFPGVVSLLALTAFASAKFAGIGLVPKFVFTGILASEGLMMLDRFFITPYKLAGPAEWMAVAVIALIAFFNIVYGFLVGVVISMLLYSLRFYRTGCVKLTGTGLTIRSTVDRGDAQADWLSSHGEKIRVVQLRGAVAFANVAVVLDIVADMLEMNGDVTASPQKRFLKWMRSLCRSICLSHGSNVGAEAVEMHRLSAECPTNDIESRLYGESFAPPQEGGSLQSPSKQSPFRLGDLFTPPAPPPSELAMDILHFSRATDGAGVEVGMSTPTHSISGSSSPEIKSRSQQPLNAYDSEDEGTFQRISATRKAKRIFEKVKRAVGERVVRFSSGTKSGAAKESSQGPLLTEQGGSKDRDPSEDFFKPEFLVIDMALVVGVDASALDTFKQIADHCYKANVALLLSGSEPHLDLLERSGIFSKRNRFADLDLALVSCEDQLLERYGLSGSYADDCNDAVGTEACDSNSGFYFSLQIMKDRHNIEADTFEMLKQLATHVTAISLQVGDVLMDTTQGSPIDLDEDGLYFIERGYVTVQRDPNQSLAMTARTSRRRRMTVAPRLLRLKHRTFQLTRLGPGWLLGATELCSGYRSMGQFVVQSPTCKAHFLPFRTIAVLERSDPLLALRVYQLAAMVVADRYDRSKEQLAHLIDTVYGPTMKVSTATEKALKKARFTLEDFVSSPLDHHKYN